ncbi:heat-inducible transcription repressor HrcA [Aerococcaceae bacterium DSM 111020]|nr:heat-inducible transcription repressor HrcA [Aerococcaceae bacterium DSM 111020]
MLTSRQEKVLALIIEQFNETNEPVGSKSLLQHSDLNVSSATIRNDMANLEKAGYLRKIHTSSGRAPSITGYRYYINQLIELSQDRTSNKFEEDVFDDMIHDNSQQPMKKAQLASQLMSSMTGFTTFVLGQNDVTHYFETFRLVKVDSNRFMGILITQDGDVGNQLFTITVPLEYDALQTINELINRELEGLTLSESYQRMKLTIPLIIQRAVGYQLDFSKLFEKIMIQLKGHDYFVSGKEHIYQLINPSMTPAGMSTLMTLIDGSSKTYQLISQTNDGIDVLFGYDLSPNILDGVNLLTGTYYDTHHRITLGVIGPLTMGHTDVILLLDQAIDKLTDK